MVRAVGLIVALAGLSSGCTGDDAKLAPDALLARLEAAGFHDIEPGTPNPKYPLPSGYRYWIMRFDQPIDHANPDAGTFTQRVSLLHVDERAPRPMVIHTNGYEDNWGFYVGELAQLLAGNQVALEHRYFGDSRPAPTDWQYLTVAQMAEDEHAVIAALHEVYGGAFLSTGGSKGAVTALAHRRAYPDDVAGSVLYSAPLLVGDASGGDDYPTTQLADLGEEGCRERLQALTNTMLREHAALTTAMGATSGYGRVTPAAALEAAILNLDWVFWQNDGVRECANMMKQPSGTADELLAFLEHYSPVVELDDDSIGKLEAYYYQSYRELGYPEGIPPFVDTSLVSYAGDEDAYLGKLPGRVAPAYDPSTLQAISDFVHGAGDRLMFVYGGWDPWAARPFALGAAQHSGLFSQDMGTHSVKITTLADADQDAAYALLADWTGVSPARAASASRRANVDRSTQEPMPAVSLRADRK